MARFAEYDPTAAEPAPVLGWYDTGALDYRTLPAEARRLALDDDAWDGRRATPFVRGGKLVAGPTEDAAVVLAAAARGRRDALLTACDWTQLPDAPLSADTRAAWASYRQALRQVPDNAKFPATIAWPVPPGGA